MCAEGREGRKEERASPSGMGTGLIWGIVGGVRAKVGVSISCSPVQSPPGILTGTHHGSSPRSRCEMTAGLHTGGPAQEEEGVGIIAVFHTSHLYPGEGSLDKKSSWGHTS